MTGSTIAPPWFVLPLAAGTMLLIAGYLTALRLAPADQVMPPSRKRIRLCSAWTALLTVPVIACGFGVVPPANARAFTLVWTAGTGLVLLVLALALIDLGDTWRIRRAVVREQREHLAEVRRRLLDHASGSALGERRDALRYAPPVEGRDDA